MVDPDEVVLVSSMTWLTDGAASGYHKIDTRTGLRMLEGLDEHRMMDARCFAALLGRFDLYRMDDHEVLDLIRTAIADGSVVVVQKGSGKPASVGATAELRRLVAQVEKATRGKLSYRGRNYRLVVGVELAKMPDRDYYEIASQSEARAVLDGIAQESPASAEPVRKASEELGNDWRPPLQPDGLALLRRIPTRATLHVDTDPAITPSQMKTLLDAEKSDDLVLELEHLYHDDRPVYEAPFTVELSDGGSIKGQLDATGKATVHLQVIPTRVQFGPDSRPWKKVDQTTNPDYQETLTDVDGFIDSHLERST